MEDSISCFDLLPLEPFLEDSMEAASRDSSPQITARASNQPGTASQIYHDEFWIPPFLIRSKVSLMSPAVIPGLRNGRLGGDKDH
jgi:hypothetical protein